MNNELSNVCCFAFYRISNDRHKYDKVIIC